jgi:hypothetical protein
LEVKEEREVKIKNTFPALEDLGDNMIITRAWKVVR